MTGVHMKVLGGHQVWPLAIHQLVTAGDRRALTPVMVGSWSGGVVHWADHCVPPGDAHSVLAALGLLPMKVKCMIPEELGGGYKPEVSEHVYNHVTRVSHLITLLCHVCLMLCGGVWTRRWQSCLHGTLC